MYVQALKGYEEVLRANDLSTLLAVSNLGSLFSEQGKSKKVGKIYSAYER